MNREEDKLDDLWRKRLEQFSPEPLAEIWEKIRSAREKKSSRTTIFRWAAVAAVLLIAIVTGVWEISRHPLETVPGTAIKTATIPPVKPEILLSEKKTPVKNENLSTRSLSTNPNLAGSTRTISHSQVSGQSEAEQDVRKENSSVLALASPSYEIPTPLEKLENSHPEGKLVPGRRIAETEKHPGEVLLLATGTPIESRSRKIPAEWKIGLHLSPAYSSHTSSYSASYAGSMTSSGSQSQTGIGGGISLQVKTSRRWKIESGLYYARSGDKSGSSGRMLTASMDNSYMTAVSSYFSNSVSVQNGQMSMNSSAGVIRLKGTPSDAKLLSGSEVALEMKTTLLTSARFYQVFDFMEVPFTAVYTVLDGKIGVQVIGGVSTNFVVGNQVFLGNSSSREYVGKTEDIAKIGLAGLAGLELMYPLSNKISLSVKPQASYWLNSLNKSSDVVFRPWKVGIYSGLTYSF